MGSKLLLVSESESYRAPSSSSARYLLEKEIDDRDQGQMLDGFFIQFP